MVKEKERGSEREGKDNDANGKRLTNDKPSVDNDQSPSSPAPLRWPLVSCPRVSAVVLSSFSRVPRRRRKLSLPRPLSEIALAAISQKWRSIVLSNPRRICASVDEKRDVAEDGRSRERRNRKNERMN